jgi:hypothetical protein
MIFCFHADLVKVFGRAPVHGIIQRGRAFATRFTTSRESSNNGSIPHACMELQGSMIAELIFHQIFGPWGPNMKLPDLKLDGTFCPAALS